MAGVATLNLKLADSFNGRDKKGHVTPPIKWKFHAKTYRQGGRTSSSAAKKVATVASGLSYAPADRILLRIVKNLPAKKDFI